MPHQFSVTFSSAATKLHSDWKPYFFRRELPEEVKLLKLNKYEVALQNIWIPPITMNNLLKLWINEKEIVIDLSTIHDFNALILMLQVQINRKTKHDVRLRRTEAAIIFKLRKQQIPVTNSYRIRFSDIFKNKFNIIPNEIVLSEKKRIYIQLVPAKIIQNINEDLQEHVANAKSPIVGLSCDLIKHVYLNQQAIPFLQLIDITKTNTLQTFNVNPLFHICKDFHPTITFQLVSLFTNKLYKFDTEHNIYVTLLFREKK